MDVCAACCCPEICLARTLRSRRLCELADLAGPAYRESYARRVCGGPPGQAPIAGRPVPTEDPLFALIQQCPHWIGAGCSCGLDLCTFAWRRRKVALADCRECLGMRT